MLIHSIICPEAILATEQTLQTAFYPWKNGWIEGCEQNGVVRIQRMISTDLTDYLDSSLSPGQVLPYK